MRGTIGVAWRTTRGGAAFLKAAHLDGSALVLPPRSSVEVPLAEALQSRLSFEIAPTPALLSAAALSASSQVERNALEEAAALPAPQLAQYTASRHLAEVFTENRTVALDAALLANSCRLFPAPLQSGEFPARPAGRGGDRHRLRQLLPRGPRREGRGLRLPGERCIPGQAV
jgi:hypothetical protein